MRHSFFARSLHVIKDIEVRINLEKKTIYYIVYDIVYNILKRFRIQYLLNDIVYNNVYDIVYDSSIPEASCGFYFLPLLTVIGDSEGQARKEQNHFWQILWPPPHICQSLHQGQHCPLHRCPRVILASTEDDVVQQMTLTDVMPHNGEKNLLIVCTMPNANMDICSIPTWTHTPPLYLP